MHSEPIYVLSRLATQFARSSGRSSGVEHNLAKVRVVSSNLIARSIYQKKPCRKRGAFLCLSSLFQEPKHPARIKNDILADPGFGLDEGESVV